MSDTANLMIYREGMFNLRSKDTCEGPVRVCSKAETLKNDLFFDIFQLQKRVLMSFFNAMVHASFMFSVLLCS